MEWYRLPEDSINCPLYLDWVEIFFESGYIAVNPGGCLVMEITDYFKLFETFCSKH